MWMENDPACKAGIPQARVDSGVRRSARRADREISAIKGYEGASNRETSWRDLDERDQRGIRREEDLLGRYEGQASGTRIVASIFIGRRGLLVLMVTVAARGGMVRRRTVMRGEMLGVEKGK